MTIETSFRAAAERPSFRALFTPKLVTILSEGYGFRALRADIMAGLTVAIVALPLSMAIAIASGTTPERGLYTAIVGGFLVSALGGSRFQIGGPAGAFIVLVAAAVDRHGIDGLVLATAIAGLLLMAAGFLRLGTYIKFIPYPVTVGFTAGIAVIIFASQIRDLFGLTLAGKEPGEILPKLAALAQAGGTINPVAVALAAASIGLIVGVRRWRPHWPGMLIAVAVTALATWAFSLPVETIGTRFGGIPSTMPSPHLPDPVARKDPGRVARCARLRAARRHRIASVGRGGRRHDRPPPSLELRAGGARRGQHRLRAVRRHLRHRHDRTHRHQRAGRCARARRRHGACGVPAAVHPGGGTACLLYPAGGARRRPGGRRLEHGGKARIPRAAAQLARRRGRPAGDLRPHRPARPHRRDRRRLRHRLDPDHSSPVADGRHPRRHAARAGRPRRRRCASQALRAGAGLRQRGGGLPPDRRVLLRHGVDGQRGARPDR